MLRWDNFAKQFCNPHEKKKRVENIEIRGEKGKNNTMEEDEQPPCGDVVEKMKRKQKENETMAMLPREKLVMEIKIEKRMSQHWKIMQLARQ